MCAAGCPHPPALLLSFIHSPPPPLPSLPCPGSLRPLDIEFLQRLCRTVNVVPVIARADSLTMEEREAFRRRVIWVPGAGLGSAGQRAEWAGWAEVTCAGSPDPAEPEDPLHRRLPPDVL